MKSKALSDAARLMCKARLDKHGPAEYSRQMSAMAYKMWECHADTRESFIAARRLRIVEGLSHRRLKPSQAKPRVDEPD